ncbi:MAG: cytochrome C oxidase subunit II [Gemmatimonadetes bacterium]|nr:cytochrome C oxidase subunit II [Gemmatimonadota bacterium]
MVDSKLVLAGQTIAYTCYVLAIMALVAWFAYRVTREGKPGGVRPGWFWSFVSLLVVIGVSLHLITYNTIPWVALDLHRGSAQPDTTITIAVAEHRFQLPADRIVIPCGRHVLFRVTSADLTYGFGLFREDHTMVFQMQVVPGHDNDLLWEFDRAGVYSIRSTEYSGPAGYQMVVPDAVEVVCPTGNAAAPTSDAEATP